MAAPTRTRLLRPVLAIVVLLAGCASAPPETGPHGLDPARLRVTRGQGFVVHDDGLEPNERAELFRELVASRAAIGKLLGPHLAPGDFRTYEERHQGPACSPAIPADVKIFVHRSGSRCHADGEGVTIVRDHLARRDATHELVHYLTGASWRPIDEGLAVYLTERFCGPAWGVPVDTRARVYLDLNLDERLDRERLKNGMSRRDYDLAGSFVKWLIETRGIDKLMELYRAAPGDYMGVYGDGELDLQARWLATIKARAVRQDGDYYRFRDYLVNLRNR